jgi:hypothetical protein
MNPTSDFMHPDRDRVISFVRDEEGRVSFHILSRIDPLEFEGLQKVYWRKIYRSEAYAGEDAAFAVARQQFAWVEAGWRDDLRI